MAGRDTQLKRFNEILDTVESGKPANGLVHGLRGVGKTVLLEEFRRICIQRGFLPIRRSQFSEKYSISEEFGTALRYDVRTTIETFSRVKRIKDGIKSAVSYIKPKSVGVPDIFYYEPAYGGKKDTPFEDYLKDYLTTNWPVFEKAGFKGVVFLYDEFHTLVDKKYYGEYVLSDFIAAINESQKASQRYVAVLCGLPNLRLNVKQARSYTERMFTDIEVGYLDEGSSREAIERALRGSGYTFTNALVDTMIADTGGYPYFIQYYGKEIITNVAKAKVELTDYEQVKSFIAKELDVSFFDPRYELASPEEQDVLCAMSKHSGSDITFDFIRKTTGKSRTGISRILNRLEKKGMTYNLKRGTYRFSLPMFREYLKKRCG